jgi:Bacterial Ig domain
MRKFRYLILYIIILLACVSTAFAQDDAGLHLTLKRDFGYAGGSDIQGAFTMRATGPEDLERVVFYIDGETMGEASQAPFELSFHTGSYPLGPHTLTAEGFTASGVQVASNTVQVNFVSANQGFQAGLRIALPLFGIVFVLIGLSFVVSFATSGKLKNLPPGAPRQYGAAGGAICPRCGRPFARHVFSLNLLAGKLERCPFCGKWSVLAARPLSVLRAAEAAELDGAEEPAVAKKDEEEHLRKELDESRFLEL